LLVQSRDALGKSSKVRSICVAHLSYNLSQRRVIVWCLESSCFILNQLLVAEKPSQWQR